MNPNAKSERLFKIFSNKIFIIDELCLKTLSFEEIKQKTNKNKYDNQYSNFRFYTILKFAPDVALLKILYAHVRRRDVPTWLESPTPKSYIRAAAEPRVALQSPLFTRSLMEKRHAYPEKMPASDARTKFFLMRINMGKCRAVLALGSNTRRLR